MELFRKICDEFLNFIKTKPLETLIPKGTWKFNLYVLPSNGNIVYEDHEKEESNKSATDAFGNKIKFYPTRPTTQAKFMSYDDPAFVVNCKQGVEFYKLLNTGYSSFEKINFYPQDYFKLAGLYWYFQNLGKNDMTFNRRTNGIYHQIYDNYLKLKKNDTLEQQIVMKAVCMKQDNAKIEILLEENFTMAKLENILKIKDDIPESAFESLIIKKKNSVLWSPYLEAVRALLQGRTLERIHFVRMITNILKDKLYDWLEKKKYRDANKFIKQTFFCIKLLTKTQNKSRYMDVADEYAYNVGKIAGQYVEFKKSIGEDNNSLKEILTYSKYDREKLRFVHKRVCLGINLAKLSENEQNKLKEMINFVKENTPKEEIEDPNAYKDNSYFFYKGVFEQLGGTQ